MTYKTKFAVIAILLSTVSLFAQNAKDEFLPIIAEEICNCIEAKNIDYETATSNDIEVQLGICIIQSYGSHMKVIKKEYGDVLNNDAKMEEFATDIGVQMVSVCPDIIIAAAGDEIFEDEVDYNESEATGTFIKVNTSNKFRSFEFKEEGGKRYTLYWLDYFSGDEYLYEDEKDIKKGEYYISFKEVELFDSEANEYRIFKVITSLSKM